MEIKIDIVRLLLIFTSISPSLLHAEDVCVVKSPCSCEFSNGTGIDLTPTATKTFYSAQIYEEKSGGNKIELSTYFYHPCIDVNPLFNVTGGNNTCMRPLSICRYLRTMTMNLINTTYSDIKQYEYMGSSDSTMFSSDGRSIIYTNGPSATVVMLECSETADQLHVYSLAEPNKIVLQFYSSHACLKQIEEIGRSFGSTLLIILFSLAVFYIVLGVCTKKFLMGATGLEVIPNLGFWTDLPNLVKDGWAFTINGFKLPARSPGPVTSPDPNSYDSI